MKIFIKSSKYKRIARTDESDKKLFFDWKQLSAEEAEALPFHKASPISILTVSSINESAVHKAIIDV